MSERLEQWKAREKLRSAIGWVAVVVGLMGALGILFTALDVLGVVEIESNVPWPVAFAFQIALVGLGIGVWNTRTWARWTLVTLLTIDVVWAIAALLLDGTARIPIVSAGVLAYMLLPSTRSLFAQAEAYVHPIDVRSARAR